MPENDSKTPQEAEKTASEAAEPTPATENTRPSDPQAAIDAALQEWNGSIVSKQAVAYHMRTHARDKDTAMTSRPFRFPKPVRTCHGPGYSAGSHSLSRKNALSPRRKRRSPDRIGKVAMLSWRARIPTWNRDAAPMRSGTI